MNPSDFIKMVAPAAVDFNKQHRIPASLLIAQGALESDWGDAAPGNNLFGIKWQPGCGFDYVEAKTQEYINGKWQTVTAKFRKYKSFADSIRDHGNFLLQSRYHNLQGADYKTACDLIYKDGYATDPQYSKSLLAIIEQYHLYQYDVKEVDKVATLLEIGSKGDLVKQVQHAINKLGYTPALVEDGIFGRDTYQAVQWAQRLKGIPSDGIVGPQTLNALELTSEPAPAPVTHNYTMTVTEQATAVAGSWAPIIIRTFDNGKPLGHQLITITENGVQVCKDYTDATTGGYEYAITESTNKTDTVTVTWTDPDGKVHTVTNTTQFTVPQPSATPIPPDDSVVVTLPILPSSDANDAVYFDITAPNGQTIQCQLDTGAFELMFTASAASILALPNEGPVTIQGVGGQSSAYYSTANFSINGVQFTNVPCVVDPSFTGYPLFGYKFFVDNGYDLLVSQKHNTITILK